jgi:hypothetical protein
MTIQKQPSKARRQSALTLVEMLVATTLLVVIMLGLTAMFNQTQRAFRSGLKQVDVFEGGRAVMDLISRDVEQAVNSKSQQDWSFVAGQAPFSLSLAQNLPGNGQRANFLYETYFLNYSTGWDAIGYRVLNSSDVDATKLSYGTLYRFATNFSQFDGNFLNEHYKTFTRSPSVLTNESLMRIADGIVHFRLKFYDANGRLIPPRDDDGNVYLSPVNNPTNIPPGVWIDQEFFANEPMVIFSNTLPAMVEVELGILEPRTLKQAESLPVAARQGYLEKQAGKVHIFRQQIPIRNASR